MPTHHDKALFSHGIVWLLATFGCLYRACQWNK